MPEVKASVAKARPSEVPDDVERGQMLLITHHGGGPPARLTPVGDQRQRLIDEMLAELEAFRQTMPALTLTELLAARHDGHAF